MIEYTAYDKKLSRGDFRIGPSQPIRVCAADRFIINKEKKMANIKSAKKRILVSNAKALRNRMLKTQLKTVIKKYDLAVASGDKEAASEAYRLAVKKVDQAVAHGILHKNNAAHKKSAFTKKFNEMA